MKTSLMNDINSVELNKIKFSLVKKKKAKRAKFKFIDLFSGIGGMRLPFESIGGECVFSSEIDKNAQLTYFCNFKETPSGDICQIASKDIPQHDILLAGFPCQAFFYCWIQKGSKG